MAITSSKDYRLTLYTHSLYLLWLPTPAFPLCSIHFLSLRLLWNLASALFCYSCERPILDTYAFTLAGAVEISLGGSSYGKVELKLYERLPKS